MYGCGNTNLVIWTVGHSTLSFQEFFEFLAGHRIERLADVRRFPASQRVPWATKQVLAAALRDRGIDYEHFEDLGGFRKPMVDSRNTGWRNAGFSRIRRLHVVVGIRRGIGPPHSARGT